ncbi:transcription factor bHLH96-like [Malania oleifera]|uniref:transcription factor bHLH96-like n=1 Tax=Malania oleifera TaxID=397392 RepID=UPI0025AEB22E|nr:transcription factor bHLH96-like [Malania oleifera]
MALEAVVFQQDHFGYSGRDLCNMGNWGCEFSGTTTFGTTEEEKGGSPADSFENFLDAQTGSNWSSSHFTHELHHFNSSPEANGLSPGEALPPLDAPPTTALGRPKRRRLKSRKNKEDIENQRMTHIAVERNRRKQMNEYLSVLRSLMPDSYVQRGDQASIIGGAINFVKELEQRLQFLGTQKEENSEGGETTPLPFSEFFAFPQYSTTSNNGGGEGSSAAAAAAAATGVADVEVTMVESHANLKIRSRRRPKQLLKVVSGLQTLRLTILHLNVSTVHQFVLYSLSVKVEDDCRLTSVDEIASAVHQLLGRIQEEATLS